MILLWILFGIAVLLLLLLLTRVSIKVEKKADDLTVHAGIGLIRIRVFPPKRKKTEPKEAKKPAESTGKNARENPKITFPEIKEAVRMLWPAVEKALRRTRKGIRIHPLEVSCVLGAAEDPAAGAEQYGWAQAGIWAGMPVLENVLVIPEPSIHVGIDFDSGQTLVEGKVKLSARIGTLVGVALTVAVPALRWFWRRHKKQKEISGLQDTAKR